MGEEGDGLRGWIWAVKQQECIYLRCDGRWIEMAQQDPMGWVDSGEYGVFLSDYGVKRGYAAKLLSSMEGQKWFVDICSNAAHRIEQVSGTEFPRKLDNERKRITQLSWKRLIKNGDAPDDDERGVSSLTMKSLWYFLPFRVPMYDRQARLGLARLLGKPDRSINSENFIEHFFGYYERMKSTAEKAIRSCGSRYQYPIRVVDKFLWLHGYGGRREFPGPTDAAINRFMWENLLARQQQ